MKKTDNYKKHKSWNPLQRYLLENFYKILVSMVKPLKIKNVLDIGCGEGFTLNKFYKNKIGEYLEGVDNSDDAIKIGKKLHPFLILKQANAYKLPYKDNVFDLVVCSEVLEHLYHPRDALKEILRVSGKYCLMSVPNEPIFRIANFLRGKNITRLGNDAGHIQQWSSNSFGKFLKKEKVKILERKTPFPWTIILIGKK